MLRDLYSMSSVNSHKLRWVEIPLFSFCNIFPFPPKKRGELLFRNKRISGVSVIF
jgi:hypothetical protein